LNQSLYHVYHDCQYQALNNSTIFSENELIVVYEEAKKGKAKTPNELLQYIPMNKIESFHCRQLTDYEDTALFEIDVVNGGKIEVIYRNDLKKTW
jgi:hypothetical protein